MSTPEQIQRDIESTRHELSQDVDRLTEKVSPGRVVGRRVDRVKSGASSVREKVMGAMPDGNSLRSAGDSAGSGLSSAKDSVGNVASSVTDAAGHAPQAVKQRAQGNPLGAGLVAFGVGMVLASLVPATERERELAAKAEQQAQQAAGPLQDKAKELAAGLQDSAQQSAQQVKQVATEAATDTVEQAKSKTEDVKAPLQQ